MSAPAEASSKVWRLWGSLTYLEVPHRQKKKKDKGRRKEQTLFRQTRTKNRHGAKKKRQKNTKNGDSSLGSKTVDLRSFSVGWLLLWWVATAHVNAASTSGWELEQGHLRAPLGVPRMQSQQPVKTVPLLTRGFVERRDERARHVGILATFGANFLREGVSIDDHHPFARDGVLGPARPHRLGFDLAGEGASSCRAGTQVIGEELRISDCL